MKTYSAKPTDISRKWYLLDASETPLGRAATVAASLLLGKGKPSVTPHIDGGDFVIIINAEQLIMTGNKGRGKEYFRHSGFPGGLHRRDLDEAMKHSPAKVVTHAVRGMLPDNKLRPGRLQRLKVYGGSDHPHTPQTPETISLKRTK